MAFSETKYYFFLTKLFKKYDNKYQKFQPSPRQAQVSRTLVHYAQFITFLQIIFVKKIVGPDCKIWIKIVSFQNLLTFDPKEIIRLND